MNKNLLRLGGAVNLLFVVFHLAMANQIGPALASLSPDIRATISTWNLQVACALLIFACLAIFRWRDLLTTRLGNITAVAIALFWFLRAASQVVLFGWTAGGMPLVVLCLLFGLLHLIPALREWKNVAAEAGSEALVPHTAGRHADAQPGSPERAGKIPWASYAAVAWCLLFGGLHLYWALGGNAGFADFSMPSNRALAITRDPLYMGITWGVVIGCAVGIVVALAPFQSWSRRIPRWMLLTPLWIACSLFLVRGIGNPIQSALLVGGGMPFEPLAGADEQAWLQWLLIDAIVYSPYFILGGLAFGATALSASRQGNIHRRPHPIESAPA